ncbi:hypothetical protein CJJ23_04795 [Mycoplasmopsis agassizii]|uniref:Lipoprotein n=1 Tax=Mycoplasmopsis agassizii TaxID=33922 RepID=A0A269TJ27_9BACT|nr:hypothetical protein [Mycoplasmopsis agassizii]PAK20898.1 hypothetical protein CJJ23_04795 [Mycoplasmopsis agassizii]
MRKKYLIISSITLSLGFLITAVACTTENPEPPEKPKKLDPVKIPEIEKGAALFEKSTTDNKPYLQLNTWSYLKFTFSDFYWVFENYWIENSNGRFVEPRPYHYNEEEDSKISVGRFLKKDGWNYESLPSFTGLHDSGETAKRLRNFSEQNSYPNYLKSISLVKNEAELKKALRLNDDDQNKYLSYFKAIENENQKKNKTDLSNEKILEKYLPWSKTLNLDTIKKNMDFSNYDYLFVKDLYSLKGGPHDNIADLSKGVNIDSYGFDLNTKTLKIKFGFDSEIDPCLDCPVNLIEYTGLWKRLNSMFIPIAKNSINSFDMNEWNLELIYQ